MIADSNDGTKKATDRRQAKSVDKQYIYEVSIS